MGASARRQLVAYHFRLESRQLGAVQIYQEELPSRRLRQVDVLVLNMLRSAESKRAVEKIDANRHDLPKKNEQIGLIRRWGGHLDFG